MWRLTLKCATKAWHFLRDCCDALGRTPRYCRPCPGPFSTASPCRSWSTSVLHSLPVYDHFCTPSPSRPHTRAPHHRLTEYWLNAPSRHTVRRRTTARPCRQRGAVSQRPLAPATSSAQRGARTRSSLLTSYYAALDSVAQQIKEEYLKLLEINLIRRTSNISKLLSILLWLLFISCNSQ